MSRSPEPGNAVAWHDGTYSFRVISPSREGADYRSTEKRVREPELILTVREGMGLPGSSATDSVYASLARHTVAWLHITSQVLLLPLIPR